MTTTHPVLRLITRLNIGGPAIQALLLTRRLRDRYPTVLAAGRAPAHEGELTDPELTVQHVPLVRELSPLNDLRAVKAVRHLLRSSGSELIHTHMAKAGFVGRIAAGRAGNIKTVHTFHGHVLEGYFSRPIQRSFVFTERWLAARTDALIAVSTEVRDSLLDLGIGTPDRFHVIPLGFDLSKFLEVSSPKGVLRKEMGLSPDVPIVGVVSRLAAIKDHASLLLAIAQTPEVHLAVMGDGELRSELQELTVNLGIEQRVHFLGWRKDVAGCLSDCSVVALTSRNEGTPVSLIEAAAAARPVVATDVGGVRSVVQEGRTGWLVPAGDVAAISASIARLLNDPHMREEFGRAGREHVTHRFDESRLVREIAELYESLLPTSA